MSELLTKLIQELIAKGVKEEEIAEHLKHLERKEANPDEAKEKEEAESLFGMKFLD